MSELTQRSLRSRYILFSGLVAGLVVISAWFGNNYIQQVNERNIVALQLRNEVNRVTSGIRRKLRQADVALNGLLISPSDRFTLRVLNNLRQARELAESLVRRKDVRRTGIMSDINELFDKIGRLIERTRELLLKRADPNWVYPVLPYLSTRLYQPNLDFERAVEQALGEISDNDGRPYGSPLYGRFAELRSLWRRKILDFRAVIIRFSGLSRVDATPQERNVDQLIELIDQRLRQLERLRKQGKLDLESEEAVIAMRKAARAWDQNWNMIKKIRRSTIWRRDIHFLDTLIRPLQQRVYAILQDVEGGIENWSGKNVEKVRNTSRQLGFMLWGFAGIGVLFIVLIYLMLDRMVLGPVARMAGQLENEGAQFMLEDNSSREIAQLTSAFNTMRRQIHQRQMALEHQALHDSLTGLPNRALLHDRLENAIQIMRRTHAPMTLLLLDLDRFKDVNDALGHLVGDRLLQLVGQRLEAILRESDTVARLGGDEFAIVAPNTDAGQAAEFAEKIVQSIEEVFHIDGQNLYVGVSIGVAIFPEHGEDAVSLIRNADIAMYVAKGGNQGFAIYDESQSNVSADQLALVGDLHRELEKTTALQLYYQPQIDLMSREVVSVEALLRWPHPEYGFVSPESVINMAEHTGQIGRLTEWVIDTALADACRFQMPERSINISINLSAWNLQDPALPEMIRHRLHYYNVSPSYLTLEITESAMMTDPVRAREVLMALNEMGINLSVDDFGTGFSSLGYLKLLPVNDLKIDRSFVIDMLHDENDAIIVHSTIELAHNLGLRVVAEGVENDDVLRKLRQLKCDVAQGYHILRPQPAMDFIVWLHNYKPRIAR